MTLNLQGFLANRHTTGAAIVYGVAYAFTQIGPIWFPEHAGQFEKTAEVVQKIAVVYGLVAAGDASQGKKQLEQAKQEVKEAISTGDTSHLTNPEIKI